MTGIIVTLMFIAGIVLFVLLGRHMSNKTFKTPHWFELLRNAFLFPVAVFVEIAKPIVVVLVIIAFFFVFFVIPILLIIEGIPDLLETLF